MFARSAAAFVLFVASAVAAEPPFTALPQPFEMRNPPVVWHATGPDAMTIAAGPKANWFVPPWNPKNAVDSAPSLLIHPKGDFTLSAKVALQPKKRWDSGCIALVVDNDNWAKLCLENAQGDGRLSVVHVVNRGVSDDAYTDFAAPGGEVYLKVSRKGEGLSFDASLDGKTWTMFRAFTLGGDFKALRAGLLAQSPVGDGMTVAFTDIRYDPAN